MSILLVHVHCLLALQSINENNSSSAIKLFDAVCVSGTMMTFTWVKVKVTETSADHDLEDSWTCVQALAADCHYQDPCLGA